MLTGDLSKPDALPSNGGTCANQVPGKHQPNLTFNDLRIPCATSASHALNAIGYLPLLVAFNWIYVNVPEKLPGLCAAH